MIYSDNWSFMFIQLFVQKLFYFSKKKKRRRRRQQKILTTQFLTMLEKKSNISKTFVESLLKCFPLISVSKSF